MQATYRRAAWILFLCAVAASPVSAQRTPISIIGYYSGRSTMVDSFPVEKLTHIIFSFCHLKGDQLSVSNANDTLRIRHLVALKQCNPQLKVILSMGGWGGCKTCSDVFKSKRARKHFAQSVRQTLEYFHADGIDLDWEYPNFVNNPGYPYGPDDVGDFTDLVRRLRRQLKPPYEISFAAGGFTGYLDKSINWKKAIPYVDKINLMTYDLVNGYDTVTGHHTALYPSPGHPESVDHAVRILLAKGVPAEKIIVGAAFYGRIFNQVDSVSDGLFRPGRFMSGVSYRNIYHVLSPDSGFVYHQDPIAKAPYIYNPQKHWFVTYDDSASVKLKTRYVIDNHLGGMMFWELAEDAFSNGLLDALYEESKR